MNVQMISQGASKVSMAYAVQLMVMLHLLVDVPKQI